MENNREENSANNPEDVMEKAAAEVPAEAAQAAQKTEGTSEKNEESAAVKKTGRRRSTGTRSRAKKAEKEAENGEAAEAQNQKETAEGSTGTEESREAGEPEVKARKPRSSGRKKKENKESEGKDSSERADAGEEKQKKDRAEAKKSKETTPEEGSAPEKAPEKAGGAEKEAEPAAAASAAAEVTAGAAGESAAESAEKPVKKRRPARRRKSVKKEETPEEAGAASAEPVEQAKPATGTAEPAAVTAAEDTNVPAAVNTSAASAAAPVQTEEQKGAEDRAQTEVSAPVTASSDASNPAEAPETMEAAAVEAVAPVQTPAEAEAAETQPQAAEAVSDHADAGAAPAEAAESSASVPAAQSAAETETPAAAVQTEGAAAGETEAPAAASEEVPEAAAAAEEAEPVVHVDPAHRNTFVGYISHYMTYYNFEPFGVLEDGHFVQKSRKELEELLPESKYTNINLYYEPNSQGEFVKSLLHRNQIMILEVSLDDLEPNLYKSGVRNRTGYRISCRDAFDRQMLRHMYGDGLYRVLPERMITADIVTHRVVYLADDQNFKTYDGERVFLAKDGLLTGPVEVKYMDTNRKFCISPQIADHQYVLTGYAAEDAETEEVESDPEISYLTHRKEVYYRIREGAAEVTRDVITNEILMSSLKDFMSTGDFNGIPTAEELEQSGVSVLSGKYVTPQIRQARLARMQELLSDRDAVRKYSSEIADAIYGMIANDKDGDQANDLIRIILEKHEDLADQIQSSRVINEQVDAAKRELEDIRAEKEKLSRETQEEKNAARKQAIDKEIEKKKQELDAVTAELSSVVDVRNLAQAHKSLKEENDFLLHHNERLRTDARAVENSFVSSINNYSGRIADITFDGYVSSRMLEAAAKWEAQEDEGKYEERVAQEKKLPADHMGPEELADYIVSTIRKVRPGYDRNTIVNLLVCITEGFLTILAGTPGCGKTSFSNILGRTLGLTEDGAGRYIPVSVERGWTSRRDFIGYYNPLTKSFEENNHAVYDGLKLLDKEQREGIARFPFLILLDEANLSPMEYYWADFMNVCDDLVFNHTINLGNDVLEIPETLHFVATINSDHTTEALSPRLVDRAFVITLPRVMDLGEPDDRLTDAIRRVEWSDLKRAFSAPFDDGKPFTGEIQRISNDLTEAFAKGGIHVSPRSAIAIRRYWNAASVRMESDRDNNAPGVIALDYAFAQKLLPRIQGSGEEYAAWLESLKELCHRNNLLICMHILEEILERGKKQMNYYQFF